MAKVSQRQVLAYIVPNSRTKLGTGANELAPPSFGNTSGGKSDFLFAQVSGGEITASVEKIYEGGAKRPTVLCAPAEIGDITLTAHYDDDITTGGIALAIRKRIYQERGIFTESTVRPPSPKMPKNLESLMFKHLKIVQSYVKN